jgi:hypothetical protein
VTSRATAATTLQALELTNGRELAAVLKLGAEKLLTGESSPSPGTVITTAYERALGRKPTRTEAKLAAGLVGKPVQPTGVEDLLWSLTMLPEFQLIY